MQNNAPFIIYDAAAGSGKTFTLVKEYLTLLLKSNKPHYYQQLLALTFTNKAVAEMKQRIIENLEELAKKSSLTKVPDMLLAIAQETGIDIKVLHEQAKKALKHILHNYAAFTVETIDSFNHRIIRTFARDLKLPTNFEVVLDTEALLTEAVDRLISKTGIDEAITKVLIDYTLEKADDDKSWDISKDIFKASKLLNNENDEPHIAKLKDKNLKDFGNFKTTLQKARLKTENEITNKANALLEMLHGYGIDQSHFSGGYFYKHFDKLATGDFNVSFGTKWQDNIVDKPLYAISKSKNFPEIAATLDSIAPQLNDAFLETKDLVFRLSLIQNILKNLTPLSVINLVNNEVNAIKEEQSLVPISQFNRLIREEIKGQPAPFIYERLGEKYQHFFIDEFQDTSVMQWENMIPLIDNSLSQAVEKNDGSLLLVGDVKQSIYRWRGGNPEQFLNMIQGATSFSGAIPHVENLPRNWRSRKNIIEFNNDFFTFASQYLSNESHASLYVTGNQQETNKNGNGYVQLSFVSKGNKEEKDIDYGEKTLETINKLQENGYDLKDICVLTRSKKDGIALSSFLMESGIDVISSETLLLQHSPLVKCVFNVLTLSQNSQNIESGLMVLDFLHEHLNIQEEKHTFFTSYTNAASSFSEILNNHGITFNLEFLNEVSLYEAAEYIVSALNLTEKADAYLYGFMDVIFEYTQQPLADTSGFMDLWENKKEKAAISIGDDTNGVQFMTVHKSKGLEFPIVIFPYADVNLYYEREAKTWLPIPNGLETEFDEAFINFNADVANYSEAGQIIYNDRRSTLELDNYNILYVTLTRAVEQLYIFTEEVSSMKDGVKTFNHLFKEFLLSKGMFDESKSLYEFGTFQKKEIAKKQSTDVIAKSPAYISSLPAEHNLHIITSQATLWNEALSKAILQGNLFHDTMELIKHKGDEIDVFEIMESRKTVAPEILELLKKTVNEVMSHPDLKHLFNNNAIVENERDIITKDGFLLRPDRLNFNHSKKEVSIIDYKTGIPDYAHEDQINGYAIALIDMGFKISEKILVYTNDAIIVNKV
ncbi:ATP-dependent helicase [Patiriisocius marinistellae]|uniref:DNA 3'-5' helicase n=1 Tax=Patiriisocius marinistellae TaxID=2494560 RepID=A0A5J4FSF3_9FLAO|nr:UvrD-helicase domain-containing protein [Patiriisocius marinistellae]GEQ84957.1 ATP-dependent helicase [Patiriisocius marinistellae]